MTSASCPKRAGWPSVNYYQHGGEPFIGQGQTAVLYPPVYLGVALAKAFSGDTLWTIDWIAAEHLTFGLLGFYFWLRQGGMAAQWAVLGALALGVQSICPRYRRELDHDDLRRRLAAVAFLGARRFAGPPFVPRVAFPGHCRRSPLFAGLRPMVRLFYLVSGLLCRLAITLRPEVRKPAVLHYLFVPY